MTQFSGRVALLETRWSADGVFLLVPGEVRPEEFPIARCLLATSDDDVIRCAPPALPRADYADPACTEEIWGVGLGYGVVLAPEAVAVKGAPPGSLALPRIERLLVAGQRYDGPVFEKQGQKFTPTACVRRADVPNARQPYFRFGPGTTPTNLIAMPFKLR